MIVPSVFTLEPKKMNFEAHIPHLDCGVARAKSVEKVQMDGFQSALVSDNATTGHKLQGATLENLFVHTWSHRGNWVHVVLSRVKSLSGLHLRMPLSSDPNKCNSQERLENKLRELRARCPIETDVFRRL